MGKCIVQLAGVKMLLKKKKSHFIQEQKIQKLHKNEEEKKVFKGT